VLRRLVLLSFLMLVPLNCILPQEREVYYETRFFQSETGQKLPYRLLVPRPRPDLPPKLPLVLVLHGASARGSDNRKINTEAFQVMTAPAFQQVYPSFILAPQCPGDGQWVDTPWVKGSYVLDSLEITPHLSIAMEIIDMMIETFPIDDDRVYITGQSMGGYGTWDLIMRFPDRFAAAIPICGAGDPSQASRISHIPIWVFHGGLDRVVPVSASREMVKALQDRNGKIIYTEYPECGHAVWARAWGRMETFDWLFQQRRGSF